MNKELHLGKMVQEYIDSKNLKRAVVARIIDVPSTSIYSYEKQQSLQTSTLLRLSHGLKYNFFLDIANSLPREYAYSQSLVSEKDELIARLEEENKKLKLENELMKELISRRN